MKTELILANAVSEAVGALYGQSIEPEKIQVTVTRRDQKGDYTVVVFPIVKISKKNPEQTGKEIGEYLVEKLPILSSSETIKGFLNLTLSKEYWVEVTKQSIEEENYGFKTADENSQLVMIEYASPNTNKPLHLGHIRNVLLGYSLSRILSANGNKICKTNIVNDRGIHICKSMLAWQKFGNGATPSSIGQKGDHLVGDYYVRFDKEYKAQVAELKAKGMTDEEAEEQAPLMQEAREMLRKWEADDKEVRELWKMMNGWVYEGCCSRGSRMASSTREKTGQSGQISRRTGSTRNCY